MLKTHALILLTSNYEGGVGAVDELVYGTHIFPTYDCTSLCAFGCDKHKDSRGKMAKKRATAVVAGTQRANIQSVQCMSSGVQQTAVQEDGCESRAHYSQCAE